MAKRYESTGSVRTANRVVMGLVRLGLTGRRVSILTTTGRRSGESRSVPVTVFESDNTQRIFLSFCEGMGVGCH